MTEATNPYTGDLVREGEDAFARERALVEEWGPLSCGVKHPNAGGQCKRTATMEVYGLAFCEVHGAEAKAGALEELYFDAANFLERLNNPHAREPNPAASRALHDAISRLREAEVSASDRDEALKRAYPVIPERVIGDTVDFDYRKTTRGGSPVD